jgi:prolipoprotein diacylglyceryl transferase
MVAVLASIPSPATGVYHVGPLTVHMYGVMLLVAIAACIWLTGVRWARWGGDWDLIFRVAIWGVIFGVIGARIYHLITSWNQDPAIHSHWYGPFAVWSGGLGIWGAIPFGVAAGAWVVRRSGNSIRLMMDAVAPGLLLAQGIGRWGNYFNQELYGKHTTLPWALEIHGKGPANEYHPTFLYEFTWDVLGVLVW